MCEIYGLVAGHCDRVSMKMGFKPLSPFVNLPTINLTKWETENLDSWYNNI